MYYSLKTKKEEHALEPRIDGGYDYAVYDSKQNLVGEKAVVKKDDAIKFIYDKQRELKGTFAKVESIVKVDPITVEKKETKSDFSKMISPDNETLLTDLLGKVLDKKKVIREDTEHIVTAEHHVVPGSPETKDSYTISATVNLKTGNVEVDINSTPASDPVQAHKNFEVITDNLIFALVESFPDILDNYIISGGVAKLKLSMEEAREAYDKSAYGKKVKNLVRVRTLQAVQKAIKGYKAEE